jgi:protoheme IX farnesyltransferase
MIRSLVALAKPRITALSVVTAAVGLALAPGEPSPELWAAALAGTGLIVGSANTLNMYLERDIDAKMARTQHRPLPSGRLEPNAALAFGLLQALVGLPLLGWGTNLLTGALGAVALFLYVAIYTPMKQRSSLALLVGAVPGAMPPLLGWTAGSGAVALGGLLLFGILFFWQIPHFLAIAMFRRDDYRAAGLVVMPNEHGDGATRWAIASASVLQVLATLALVPFGLGGPSYLVGASLLGALMLGYGGVGLVCSAGDAWARRLFFITLGYLPLLLALLVAG